MDHPEFDTRVQHRDGKSGKVIKHTPYVLRISKEHGEVYIRNGIEYAPNGTIIRDTNPKVAAPVEETPVPLKQESAPAKPTKTGEEAQEEALGVPSTEALMATAQKQTITRKKS